MKPRDFFLQELPPRARRILSETDMPHPQIGTTSACAENTGGHTTGKIDYGNYLRVRGEYIYDVSFVVKCLELPPRARRILEHCLESIR